MSKVELKRIIELPRTEAVKIYTRQARGRMRVYFDNDGYQCFDVNETFKPRKRGRQKPQNKE